MMKKILLTIFTTLVYFATFSQDIITKKSGDEIQAKVIEVGTSEIRYKIFTNLDGPTYTISKSEIFMVKYENGTKDVFQSNSAPAVSPSSPVNPETGQNNSSSNATEMYNRGTSDAIKYYTGYKTPGTWNLVGGIACGIFMIPLPIASSLTPPEDKNLHYPNPGLFSDINYQRGYREKAKKIKSGKVWTNYLIGCGIGTLISIIVNAS